MVIEILSDDDNDDEDNGEEEADTTSKPKASAVSKTKELKLREHTILPFCSVPLLCRKKSASFLTLNH